MTVLLLAQLAGATPCGTEVSCIAECNEGDWDACASVLEHGPSPEVHRWASAAEQSCEIDELKACAFAIIARPGDGRAAQRVKSKVARAREQACRSGDVHWCRHAISGAMYVRVGSSHEVFTGGNLKWLALADEAMSNCSGSRCIEALAWSLERTSQLCPNQACSESALQLRATLCARGHTLSCVRKPKKAWAKRCAKGDGRACMEHGIMTLQEGMQGRKDLERSCSLGEPTACQLVSLVFAEAN